MEVRASYVFNGSFEIDDAAHQAAGRLSDFSGAGFGARDLGWVCQSEIEAERIARALRKIGLPTEIRKQGGIVENSHNQTERAGAAVWNPISGDVWAPCLRPAVVRPNRTAQSVARTPQTTEPPSQPRCPGFPDN